MEFGNFAHNWLDPNGSMSVLHDLNKIRIDFIKSVTNIKDQELLDFGAGAGILAKGIKSEIGNYCGIEQSEQLVNTANTHFDAVHNVNFYNSIVKLCEHRFDIITAFEVLEHIKQPEEIIKQLRAVIKPKGIIFLSTLNRNLYSFIFGIIAAEYILKIVPKNTHQYNMFIKPIELCNMLENNGFKVIKAKGISYNPVLRSTKLINDLHFNYIMAAEAI